MVLRAVVKRPAAGGNLTIVPVGQERDAGVEVRGEVVSRAEGKAIEAAVEARATSQAASVGAAEARQHLADAETALVAEPFGIRAPLATAGHVPVEVAVEAVPLGGLTGDNRIVLCAEVALQHTHHVIAELAGIDERLEISACVALRPWPTQRRRMRPGVDS